MTAVRRREAGNERADIALRQPFWQSPPHHTLSATPDAGYNNHSALAPPLRPVQEASEGRASADLSVAVQVQRTADLKFAAPDALFIGSVLWRSALRGARLRFGRNRRRFGRRSPSPIALRLWFSVVG